MLAVYFIPISRFTILIDSKGTGRLKDPHINIRLG